MYVLKAELARNELKLSALLSLILSRKEYFRPGFEESAQIVDILLNVFLGLPMLFQSLQHVEPWDATGSRIRSRVVC